MIENTPDIHHLLREASTRTAGYQSDYNVDEGEGTPGFLPASLRLAREMSPYSDDERRAMEGELHAVEQRWRDADAIAKIADEMFMPTAVDGQL